MRKVIDINHMSQREKDLDFDWSDDPVFDKEVDIVKNWACGPTCLNMVLHYYCLSDLSTYEFLNEFRTVGSNLWKLYKEQAPNDIDQSYNLCSPAEWYKVGSFRPL